MSWIDYPFDVECLPNIFPAGFVHDDSGTEWIFEVSERVNQSTQFLMFVRTLGQYPNVRMVGFNSIGYDYALIHYLLRFQSFTAADAYVKSKQIIDTPWNDRFKNTVRPRDCVVKQVDLFKVWHFDNQARSTSLKQLEIALKMNCVVEFDHPFGEPLPRERIPHLIAYNRHDVAATRKFYHESKTSLDFRDEMTEQLGEDCTNLSDSSIGSKVFISELEKRSPGICGRAGKWRQTPRAQIHLGECVFPYVQFMHPEFQRIHQHFLTTTITKTKGVFEGLEAECYGLVFKFGTGGIHGARDGVTVRQSNSRIVQGRDVASYYPNLCIKNGVFPEHLSSLFCDVYDELYHLRKSIPKSDPRNKALKLSLNGTYGNSNSSYSPFYDPKFTMTITINGQLLLCMLAEHLAVRVPTLELIQVNTDGIEYSVDAEHEPMCQQISDEWCAMTGLSLDTEDYDLFVQRDVNNYICRQTDGTVKCKGAFEYQHGPDTTGKNVGSRDGWHKNQSAKIVARAVEAFVMNGVDIAETVYDCTDPFAFMNTLKVQRNDVVKLGGSLGTYQDMSTDWLPRDWQNDEKFRKKHFKNGVFQGVTRSCHDGGVKQQRVGRYYVSHHGERLYKIMAPLKKLPNHYRPQAIEKGHDVSMSNDVHYFDWNNLNRQYYIDKAIELVENSGFK